MIHETDSVQEADGAAVSLPALSAMERRLWQFLESHLDQPVSRADLLRQVWRLEPGGVLTRTVDMHIAKLRRKMRLGSSRLHIVTVRGRGYVLRQSVAARDGFSELPVR